MYETGDYVYVFFREVAIEYINCGKASFTRKDELLLKYSVLYSPLSLLYLYFSIFGSQ